MTVTHDVYIDLTTTYVAAGSHLCQLVSTKSSAQAELKIYLSCYYLWRSFLPAKSCDNRRLSSIISCEKLCCEVLSALLNALIDDATPQHMDKLCSLLLQKQNKFDNHRAGYFEKVSWCCLNTDGQHL
jgi:hypothetical protein